MKFYVKGHQSYNKSLRIYSPNVHVRLIRNPLDGHNFAIQTDSLFFIDLEYLFMHFVLRPHSNEIEKYEVIPLSNFL